MANYKNFDEDDGVWRTVGGRRIFIRNGQSLSDAMKESGKFKSTSVKEKNKKALNYEEFEKKIKEIQERPSYKEKMDKAVEELNEKYGYKVKEENDKSKENITDRDAKDLIKQLNDEGSDFTFDDDVEIKDGKIKTNVGVFMPDERGYVNRELEIPIDKNETYDSLEEKMRDWQDKHSTPDSFYDKDFESSEKSKQDKFNETMNKRQKIIEDLDNKTKDLNAYDKYNLAISKLEQKDDMTPTERQYWAGTKERYEKNAQERLEDVEKRNQAIENGTHNDYIVNDDEKGFKYSFRVGDRNMFEVRYDRTGNNKNMDFATSSSELNRKRTDISRGGQAQKDLLKEGTKARDFFEKWDKQHLKALTKGEYDELINDIEELKKEYPYIESQKFSDQAQLDRDSKKSTKVKSNSATNESIKNRESKIEKDILEHFSEDYGYDGKDNLKSLKSQIDYMRNPNESIHKTAEHFVEGGGFLVYNEDIKNYLKENGIKHNDDNFFDVYKKTMADSIEKLYNSKGQSNSITDSLRQKAYKKYLKEHPNSKMTYDEYIK